jgi:hypothetical protein
LTDSPDEIEVTPEMIDVGAEFLRVQIYGRFDSECDAADVIAEAMFRCMAAQSPARRICREGKT